MRRTGWGIYFTRTLPLFTVTAVVVRYEFELDSNVFDWLDTLPPPSLPIHLSSFGNAKFKENRPPPIAFGGDTIENGIDRKKPTILNNNKRPF